MTALYTGQPDHAEPIPGLPGLHRRRGTTAGTTSPAPVIVDTPSPEAPPAPRTRPTPAPAPALDPAALAQAIAGAVAAALPQQQAGATADQLAELAGELDSARDSLRLVAGRVNQLEQTTGTAADQLGHHLGQLVARIDAIENRAPQTLRIEHHNAPAVTIHNARPELARLLRIVTAAAPSNRNAWLYGPPGTGKSVLARTLAEALDRPYTELAVSPTTTPAALYGSAAADGHWTESAFVHAWENGHVILLDELSASDSLALAVNNALANGELHIGRHHDPARRVIRRHVNTVVIVADNTTGAGNAGGTLTRSRLDQSVRDRFAGRYLRVDYWRELEERLAGPLALHLWELRTLWAPTWHVTTRMFAAAADMLAAGWTQHETAAQILAGADQQALDKARALSFWAAAIDGSTTR
jgi:MoxR-like ATPase